MNLPTPPASPPPIQISHSDISSSSYSLHLYSASTPSAPVQHHSAQPNNSINPSPLSSSSQSSTSDLPTHPTKSTQHMTTRAKVGIFKPKFYSLSISPSLLPRSALDALLIPAWRTAMLAEYIALLKNHTWILTTFPPGKN